MTVRCSDWVWEHSQTTGNERLVMLALADEANDDGTNCFPSQDTIAAKTRIPKRTIQRCIARCEAAGELIVDRPETKGRGQFNAYVLVMGRPSEEMPVARPWLQEGRQNDTLPVNGKGASGVEKRRAKARPGGALPLDPSTTDPSTSACADSARLCELLANSVRAHRGGTGRPKIDARWLRDMDLLLRRGPLGIEDAAPLAAEKIEAAIRYTFEHLATPGADGFCWADQIQSPGGLRKKYQRLRDARRAEERRRNGAVNAGVNPHFARYDDG